jgi:hypothetical protein
MSSPDREKEREMLRKIDDFAQRHNEKGVLVEKIHQRLFALNLKQLKEILKRMGKWTNS